MQNRGIERLLREAGLAQPFSESIGVGGISKRQSTKMIYVRVSRIYLHKLVPDLVGPLRVPQMTQR